jgi:hypothetical protein
MVSAAHVIAVRVVEVCQRDQSIGVAVQQSVQQVLPHAAPENADSAGSVAERRGQNSCLDCQGGLHTVITGACWWLLVLK